MTLLIIILLLPSSSPRPRSTARRRRRWSRCSRRASATPPCHSPITSAPAGSAVSCPVTSFALVAITGNIYEGLWYAVVFTGISVVVSLLFLKETAGPPPAGSLALTGHQWMSIGCSASASTRPIGSFELCPSAIACSSNSRFFVAGDRDQDRPRRQDRRAGQGHARHRRFGGHRIGHDADRAPRLGRIERRPGGQGRRRSTPCARPRPCRATPGRAATAGPAAARRPNCRRACSRRFRSRSGPPARRPAGTPWRSRGRC